MIKLATNGDIVDDEKKLQFVFLMDPYESLNFATETSLLLIGELLMKGHKVFWLEMDGLSLRHDKLWGQARAVKSANPVVLHAERELNIELVDSVVTRIDPPFNQRYLHLTYLLDFLPSSVIQINSVSALRNVNEKLFALNWPLLVPPSITTSNRLELMRFIHLHRRVIIKPLDDCSGRGIIKLDADASNFEAELEEVFVAIANSESGSPYITAQKFLDEVVEGDKRIYLVNGEPLGWVNRIPKRGSYLANIHQGAVCSEFELTARDRHIIEAIKPELVKRGLLFVGLDIIGGYMTEINVTSPSAVRQINAVMNIRMEEKMVSAMVGYVRSGQSATEVKLRDDGMLYECNIKWPVHCCVPSGTQQC